jgi:hypothetical protein
VIRLFLWIVIAVVLIIVSTTVPFGKRTLYGHVKAIWSTPEAKDARDGIREKAAPVVKDVEKRAKRAIEDGPETQTKTQTSGTGAGTGTGTGSAAGKW